MKKTSLDQKVKQINQEVFDLLLDWHFKKKKQGEDFFFMMNESAEQVRHYQEPFRYADRKDGKFVLLSFWQNYAPSNFYQMRLEIEIDLSVQFVADLEKANREMLMALFDTNDERVSLTENHLVLRYTSAHENTILPHLVDFLENLKPTIDRWIAAHQVNYSTLSTAEYFREGSFYAAPIRPEHFDEMLSRVMRSLEAPSLRLFGSKAKARPMPQCVTGVQIRNYKGIQHASVQQLPADAHWIIVTGKNGYGKSSLLQAIAIGLWGKNDADINLLNASEDPLVVIDYHYHDENGKKYLSKLSDTKDKLLNIAAYGSTRLLNQATIPSDRNRLRDGSVLSLFDNRRDLLNIELELLTAYKYNRPYFELIISIFYRLIPALHQIKINEDGNVPFVEYIEKDENGQAHQPVRLNDLAAGFRNIIAFMGDMLLRLSASNSNQTLESLAQIEGIVLIDEIELHLHPTYQQLLPKLLAEIFPRVQFIASTHSPITLLGVPAQTVILNVDRSEEAGIIVQRLDEDIRFQNMTTADILSSPVFGFYDLIPVANERIEDLSTEENYNETQRISQLKDKLKLLKAKINTR